MKIKLTGKNAQIGETITWFAAFIIIFFIMMIFVFAASALRIKNVNLFKSSDSSDSALDNYKEYYLTKQLTSFVYLDYEPDKKVIELLKSESPANEEIVKYNSLIEEYFENSFWSEEENRVLLVYAIKENNFIKEFIFPISKKVYAEDKKKINFGNSLAEVFISSNRLFLLNKDDGNYDVAWTI